MPTDRLTDLQNKLAARTGKPGYAKNCEALKAEIARVTALAGASVDRQESAEAKSADVAP